MPWKMRSAKRLGSVVSLHSLHTAPYSYEPKVNPHPKTGRRRKNGLNIRYTSFQKKPEKAKKSKRNLHESPAENESLLVDGGTIINLATLPELLDDEKDIDG